MLICQYFDYDPDYDMKHFARFIAERYVYSTLFDVIVNEVKANPLPLSFGFDNHDYAQMIVIMPNAQTMFMCQSP